VTHLRAMTLAAFRNFTQVLPAGSISHLTQSRSARSDIPGIQGFFLVPAADIPEEI
jgi:hypothetical protein